MLRQSAAHPSPSTALPSSHSSRPATKPSPHDAAPQRSPGVGHTHPSSRAQNRLQPSRSVALPSSHASPRSGSSRPSPQRLASTHRPPPGGHSNPGSMVRQSALQPSPSSPLPSSHTSSSRTTTSPHTLGRVASRGAASGLGSLASMPPSRVPQVKQYASTSQPPSSTATRATLPSARERRRRRASTTRPRPTQSARPHGDEGAPAPAEQRPPATYTYSSSGPLAGPPAAPASWREASACASDAAASRVTTLERARKDESNRIAERIHRDSTGLETRGRRSLG
jgi:hypothetical protein